MRLLPIALLAHCAVLAAQPSQGAVPLFFLENRGQAPGAVGLMAKGSGITAYFSPSEVLYRAGGRSLRIEFVGANRSIPEGTGEMPGRANFFRGSPDEWVTGVAMFQGVVYRNLYPGIELRYGADGGKLKSEFEVAPGADASAILMRYADASGLRVGPKGELSIPFEGRELREEAPLIYQPSGGGRVEVAGRFVVSGGAVRLEVAPYDRSLPLIVDPTLSYSTLLGGSGSDAATALAVDAAGSAYIAGFTSSYNFPSVNAVQTSSGGGNEVFVAKFSPSGTGLVYCTYLGGSGDDRAYGIAVDSSGSAYVTGASTSRNFPTRYPYQANMIGGKNAFVSKLGPSGNALVFSTYLGGSGSDTGNGIALDPSGNAYVVGDTTSSNFPTTGLQRSNKGGQDAFVASLSSDGKTLLYSTYLGGSGTDHGAAIAVDSSGSAYVTGATFSADFSVANAFQKSNAGGQDAFVARLAAGGASLAFSTYLGGSAGTVGYPEAGQGIALDSQGNVYVAGVTPSINFPVLNAMQASLDFGLDAFVTKLSGAGTPIYSTYFGGSGIDVGNAIAVDSGNHAFLAGYTASTDLPLQGGFQTSSGGDYDAFVAELSADGGSLIWSSYLGGLSSDTATGVALDASGNLYLAGWTLSTDFPLANAYQSINTDNYAAFVTKVSFPTAGPAVLGVSPTSGSGLAQTFTLQFSDVSGATDITSVAVLFNASTAVAGACSVTYVPAKNALALLSDAGTAPATSISPGSGAQQNSQCILNGVGSSATASGTTLTLNVSLTFQSAFAGAKTVYLEAANPAGATGWLSKGAWTVPNGTAAAVSMAPASGSGSSQAFAFQFSDSAGAADISSIAVTFNTGASTVSACAVTYIRAQNTLALLTDAGAAPGSTLTPGSGTQQNSQCILNGAGSSVSASGNALTLTLALTFQPGFQGSKSIYMQATNPSGTTAWQAKGTWTVQFGASVVSVSPASGSGSSQAFVFQFSDTGGATDLTSVAVLFNASASTVSACAITYVRAQNTLALLTDAGAAPGSTLTPGSGTQQNSQCTLNGVGSSVSTAGNALTLTLALTFQPAFQGSKSIYMQASNPSGTTAWLAEGTWAVQFVAAAASVTPASGSGLSQTFAFQFSDTGGATDLSSVAVLFNTSASTVSACSVTYVRAQNTLALVTDAGAAPGSTLTPGSGSQQNTQCTLNGAGSSVSTSGNALTLNLALTFQAAFQGAKTVYMQAANPSGSTGWQSKGSWTVPAATVAAVSVSPASGSGLTQTFAFQFSDTAGATDLTGASILLNGSTSTVSACSVTYVRAQNTLALLTDAGAAPGSTLTPGSGSQQNTQCTLNGAGSSVSTSGNVLTVNLALTFLAAFQGAKTVYMQAVNASSSTGWQSKGSWTVPAATVSVVSVSPASGSGWTQSFVFQFSDTAGATDLTSVSALFNSSSSTVSGCAVTYVRAQNTLALLTDAGAAPGSSLTPGSGSQQNTQCTLNGAGSSASSSGNVLTLTLSLTFQSAFRGSKTVFMQAANPSGTSSWQSAGTWTVPSGTASVVSVSPASGSGSSQTFSFQFSDTAGASDLTSVAVLFNTSASAVGGCSVTYVRAQNTLSLATDTGAASGNTLTPGSGTQQNGQCTLNGIGSGTFVSGNVLTLNLSLTFQTAVQGGRTIYMQAANPSGSTAWQAVGTWAMPTFPGGLTSYWNANGTSADSISGYNGTLMGGATYAGGHIGQAFNLNGNTAYVRVAGTGTVAGARTFSAWVYPHSSGIGLPILVGGMSGAGDFLTVRGNTLFLDHWGTPAYVSSVGVTPESWNYIAMTYDGSTVQFYVNGTAADPIGGDLYDYNVSTLTIGGNTIGGSTNAPSFYGLIDEVQWYSRALAASEVQSIYGGTSVSPAIPVGVPSAVSVSPASGLGASQVFAFQFSDSIGATDLTSVSALFNAGGSTASGCAVTYVLAQNALALLTDSGAAPGSTLTPGGGTQTNSQCTLNGAGSSVSVSGTTLTLNVALTFLPAFQGAKNVYMQASNSSSTTNWQAEGTWTVQIGAVVVSVSPSSGSGLSRSFAFQYLDTSGATNLTSVSALFNTSASTVGGCAITYVRAQNTLTLLTDAGATPGASLTPGSGSQQNSQCTLSGAGSSVSISGNLLTLNLALSFQAAVLGSKTIYMQATDPSGSTGWQREGSWTVQSFPVNLVSYWSADGTPNDSVSGYNGTPMNGATYATGHIGQAFSLDGSSSYVQVGGSGTIAGARTYSAWVFPHSSGNGLPILVCGAGGAGDFLTVRGTTLFLDHWGTPSYVSSVGVTPETWNHVAVTYDGSTVQFYVNGVAADAIGGTMYDYGVSTLTIGGNRIGGSTTTASFYGLIDEVQWYSRTLTASEVRLLAGQ